MPWTDEQAQLLRELGVPWARGGARAALAATEDRQSAVAEQADPAPAHAWAPVVREAEGRTGVHPVGQPAAGASAAAVRLPRPLARPAPSPEAHPPSVPAASRPDLSALDWDGLRSAVAGCQACGLSRSRTQTVFGVGSQRAEWMIVGEAPGEQEDRLGEPFVGAAGQLLDRMLAALGLAREVQPGGPGASSVYIANTLKCRPPGNRNPTPEELACCEPFLLRQVELLRPRLILAMGRFAVQSLLRSTEPVGKLRGRVHRVQGVPLVVTYHPAYLLRNPADKSKAWADLCLAASTHGGHPLHGG